MSSKRTIFHVRFSFPFLLLLLLRKCNAQIDQCRGVDIALTEEHALSVDDCLKVVNATSIREVGPSEFACVGKCVMENTGLVDAEGLPHKENIFKMVTDVLPQEVHDDIQVKFERCLDEETAELDPKDETCVSYLPLCMCIHLAFLEECAV